MSDNGKEPAFPVEGRMYGDVLGGQLYHGLTKREAFAMAALTGLRAMSHPAHDTSQSMAAQAVRDADALLAALDPTP